MIGEATRRSDDEIELDLDRRGRGPEGERLPRWTFSVARAGRAELFDLLLSHLAGAATLAVGARVAVAPWPLPRLVPRAAGGWLFVDLPQTAFPITADHPRIDAIGALVGGPLSAGETRELDRPTASALLRGLISARATPEFRLSPLDAEASRPERALVSAERLRDGALQIYLGLPAEPRRREHVKVYPAWHPRFRSIEQHIERCLGGPLEIGQNRLVEAWPEP